MTTRLELGEQPWSLCIRADGALVSAAVGYLRSRHLSTSLDIPTHAVATPAAFWGAVDRLMRIWSARETIIASIAASPGDIPSLRGGWERRERHEYVLDLEGLDAWAALPSDHQTMILQARKRGVSVHRRTDVTTFESHSRLIGASQLRRGLRPQAGIDLPFLGRLVANGAGELWQAEDGDRLVSSVLLLRATRGAYYFSGGSSDDGWASGAGHLLLFEVARQLQSEGIATLNLGGSGTEDPSREKKLGFGARRVLLQTAHRRVEARLRSGLAALYRLGRGGRSKRVTFLLEA